MDRLLGPSRIFDLSFARLAAGRHLTVRTTKNSSLAEARWRSAVRLQKV
jgi:hypothetical protein